MIKVYCQRCKKEIIKNPKHYPKKHLERKYCTFKCYQEILIAKRKESMQCNYCNKEIKIPYVTSKRTDGVSRKHPNYYVYAKRKFCSKECSISYARIHRVGHFKYAERQISIFDALALLFSVFYIYEKQ